jgi:hypothetical protein
MKKNASCFRLGCLGLGLTGLAGILIALGTFAAMSLWPSIGAQGADFLRSQVGDEAVATLETGYYQINDTLQSWVYGSGLEKAAAPWQPPTPGPVVSETVPLPEAATPVPAQGSIVGASAAIPAHELHAVAPLGSLKGEGLWSAYIQNAAGQALAYRTFLQPDSARPYGMVAVIAFDLSRTRLHFVLGSHEPYAPNAPVRSGAMPDSDKAVGILVAMFNGGFKGRHGEFGAMADQVVALPAIPGLGTLAIYPDGRVALGEWGTDIDPTADMQAWRQNGPLVVRRGQINPEINNNSPKDWGYTVDTVAPTWRSGVGLSADGGTLYYFCGPSISIEDLARSMQAAGAENAIQLDINTFWVHFVAVHPDGTLEALFPGMMKEDLNRYMSPYTRDFFYLTAVH